ncbi:MAG: replication-relaxation family protein, partial [Chloroflexota bacterium]
MIQSGKLPAIHRPGRVPVREILTPAKIRNKAEELLNSDRSNLRNVVLEMLYEFVILSEASLFRLAYDRVAISDNPDSFHRRLNDYAREGLIERVSRGVLKQALRAGLPRPDNGILRAYRLGPVGEELARIKFVSEINAPLSAIEAEEYQAHDLLCAEAMLKMQALWHEHPDEKLRGIVEVHGPRKLTLWDSAEQKAILAPDGLIVKHNLNGDFVRAFLIEYHNSNARMHVENKVAKYEALADPKYNWLWQAWELSEMPYIAVLYRQGATLEH